MSEFERLLQERVQIEQWLERLTTANEDSPESVRERVKSDYQKRLDEVKEELSGHSEEITGALERHRSVRDGLIEQQAEAEEKRAEAELRHTVGEFDDAKWNDITDEIDGSLNKIREELSGVDAEVAVLKEALVSLTPGADDGDHAEETSRLPELPDQPADELLPPIGDSEPAAATETSAPETAGESDNDAPDDALEVRDVETEEGEVEPDQAPTSDTEPMPPDAAELLGETQDANNGGTGSDVGADDVTSFSDGADQPKKGAAKTLKCEECGAMNLPTEWYCESCGAELAAL